ncbi:MAG TPA: GSU2403 family nucleotidyltransferase fold protein [Thermoanaerobaculia bacterium]|nr:GSU2403 family nucleotidyltransferase fold protein [Thermoanaerobaculia bacterium]
MDRLPETVVTLYAELLDQCIRAEHEAPGSFVSKNVRGATYWYFQQTNGPERRQTYLGRETPELRRMMEEKASARAERRPDEQRRRELVRMLAAGGARRVSAPVAQVLSILGEAGVFHVGGVLVGTQAFACYETMLGVRLEERFLRTADIDIAIDVAMPEKETDLPAALKRIEPRFFAVPELDPRKPSTSMKVRGRDLRVDFLTTARPRQSEDPVPVPRFRIAATPLRGIAYLIEEPAPAAVIGGNGILVNVPSPARFAFHKLWVARERPVSEQAKARKDIAQAAELLTILADDRPDDIEHAWRTLPSSMQRRIRMSALPEEARDLVG